MRQLVRAEFFDTLSSRLAHRDNWDEQQECSCQDNSTTHIEQRSFWISWQHPAQAGWRAAMPAAGSTRVSDWDDQE